MVFGACIGHDQTVQDDARKESTAETAIESQIRKIKQTYGVQVHYHYGADEYFPHKWRDAPISASGAPLSLKEVERLLPLIDTFLSSYPKTVIAERVCEKQDHPGFSR